MHASFYRVFSNVFHANESRTILLALPLPSRCHGTYRTTRVTHRFTSTAAARSQELQDVDISPSITLDPLDQAANLALSPQRREPESWVDLIEGFLPSTLRAQDHVGKSEIGDDAQHLPLLLSKARSTTPLKLDILSYMGIRQGRWDAVKWLIKHLAKSGQTEVLQKQYKMDKGVIPWAVAEPNPYGDFALDRITEIPVCFTTTTEGSRSILLTSTRQLRLSFESNNTHSGWLGQIWAALACMTLYAAESPAGDSRGATAMSCVLELIAYLHHIDAVPRMIYNYSKASDISGVQRPPTLSLMAYRIMAVLSDSAWKAHEEEVRKEAQVIGTKRSYNRQEIPGPKIRPFITDIGKEMWLELILWCCVEGGFLQEAGWVVSEMLRRKGDMAWKVIEWCEIEHPTNPKLNWSAMAELQMAQTCYNQMGKGLGSFGPSELSPLVDMGARTISREVILSLMDGLSNSMGPAFEVQQHLAACKNLLGKKRPLMLETSTFNKVLVDLFDPGRWELEKHPGIADKFLDFVPNLKGNNEDYGISIVSDEMEEADTEVYSMASFGLLHRTLYAHIRMGNIHAALRTFHRIQRLIDADRARRVDDFHEVLKRRAEAGDDDELISENINSIIPCVYPQIPSHILSAFLDLLNDTHFYDFGHWLLYSDEVDGPVISPAQYSEVNLQGALLRFATATQNGQLFAAVSHKLCAPLAPDILRTLLHCQITLGKWDAAEEVLKHFQNERGLGWEATDITVVARAVLRLENTNNGDPLSLEKARLLLQNFLNGHFNSYKDPSKAADYSQYRQLSQIYRMLRKVGGCLIRLRAPPFSSINRLSAPTGIPSEAFNILLEGVVETYGSHRGQRMWCQWCEPSFSNLVPEDAAEKVVAPNMQSLRILMRPLVEKGTTIYDSKLIEWAVNMYKYFGLTEKEIRYELPGMVDKYTSYPLNISEWDLVCSAGIDTNMIPLNA